MTIAPALQPSSAAVEARAAAVVEDEADEQERR